MNTDGNAAVAPNDDGRIKRVLKRYPKGGEYSDSSVDLSALGLKNLQSAFRTPPEFKSPVTLDGYALVCFGNMLQLSFDDSKFDYYLHSYANADLIPPASASRVRMVLIPEYGTQMEPIGSRFGQMKKDWNNGLRAKMKAPELTPDCRRLFPSVSNCV